MHGVIDIHIHWCQFGRDPGAVMSELEWLEGRGYEAVAVYPLPGLGAPPERVLDLIPGAYRELIGLTQECAAHDDLDAWRAFQLFWEDQNRTLELLSFLDVRAWDGRSDLGQWWGDGHTGLKSILIEEADDAKMAMPPLRLVPGISQAAYRDAQRAVFAAADGYGVPLVYHADLSLHGPFVADCLEAYPELPVDIPHFGFSRRAMAKLLDRFPALVTDISSLGPHMDTDPASYREFILAYPDRVLLGSDVIASHDLRLALEYADRVRRLELPAEVQAAVLGGNARRFLGGGRA